MNKISVQTAARVALGGALIFAGVSHLSFARKPFKAQVPEWVPLEKDTTVLYSGVTEVALGSALVLAKEKHRETVGNLAAAFFVAIFPGNIAQYRNHRSAFGLDSDNKRFVRLFFQPALVYWALKSTRAKR